MNQPPLAAISHLTAGRSQIGTSLSFHLFFAVLGVGLPLMMLVAEGMHLRTGDPVWRALARRWSKVFAVLFAVGAASGTIISFELGLLFPRFMAYAGGIIGLPFSLEGAAFFIEAIFVGIYLYGWDRLSPRAHWLSGIPIAISAVASAFFIVTANAWMNVPRGFQIVHGRVTHVDPLAAMFNPAWATETSPHGLRRVPGDRVRGRLRVRGRDAARPPRRLPPQGDRRGAGDGGDPRPAAARRRRSARPHRRPPPAGEARRDRRACTHTERGAGLNIGGFPLPGHDGDGAQRQGPAPAQPARLRRRRTRPVRGLDTFPKADRTPAGAVRAPRVHRHGRDRHRPGRPQPLVLAAPPPRQPRARGPPDPDGGGRRLARLAFLANELGWLVSELGRQPWIVYGVFRTSSGITTAPGLGATFTAFTLLYIGLTALTVWSVRRIASKPVEGLPSRALAAA